MNVNTMQPQTEFHTNNTIPGLSAAQNEAVKIIAQDLLAFVAKHYSEGHTSLPKQMVNDQARLLTNTTLEILADSSLEGVKFIHVIKKAENWNHIYNAGDSYGIKDTVLQYLPKK